MSFLFLFLNKTSQVVALSKSDMLMDLSAGPLHFKELRVVHETVWDQKSPISPLPPTWLIMIEFHKSSFCSICQIPFHPRASVPALLAGCNSHSLPDAELASGSVLATTRKIFTPNTPITPISSLHLTFLLELPLLMIILSLLSRDDFLSHHYVSYTGTTLLSVSEALPNKVKDTGVLNYALDDMLTAHTGLFQVR